MVLQQAADECHLAGQGILSLHPPPFHVSEHNEVQMAEDLCDLAALLNALATGVLNLHVLQLTMPVSLFLPLSLSLSLFFLSYSLNVS